jgi:acyl-CoA synthetase (NDP forming)
VPELGDINVPQARETCTQAIGQRGPGWLTFAETRAILSAFGLPVAPGEIASTADEAAQVAGNIGFPVAVKSASHHVVHKSERGLVRLNLPDAAAVQLAFQEIKEQLATLDNSAAEGVLIQPMLSGVEVMVGAIRDPAFGPLICFGLGGIHVELLGDVRWHMTPLTDCDADEMIRSIRGFPLLCGYRGQPPADVAAIQQILLRAARLVEEIQEIRELDLNPVVVLSAGKGCLVVDARMRVKSGLLQ